MNDQVKPWMTITDDTVGVWFVGFGSSDWMCHVYRDAHTFHIMYRFKYYASHIPHDPRDVTQGNEFVVPLIETSQVINDVDVLADDLYNTFHGIQRDRILMEGTVPEFYTELKSKNWVHVATKH